MTPCYHIFHIKCFHEFIFKHTHMKCPLNCEQVIWFNELGKTADQITQFVFDHLRKHENEIIDTLAESDLQNCVCAICQNGHVCKEKCVDCDTKASLPVVPIRWDADKKQLVHANDTCGAGLENLKIEDLIKIIKAVHAVNEKVKKELTQTPPTYFELARWHYREVKREHPYFLKFIGIELISIAALVLNRYKFEGENWPLYALSIPALITLTAAHQVAIAVIAVLNTHQA